MSFDRGKRRIFFFLATIGVFILFINLSLLSGKDVRSAADQIPVPGLPKKPPQGADARPDPNVRFVAYMREFDIILTFFSGPKVAVMER
jgi:hypothetical protein